MRHLLNIARELKRLSSIFRSFKIMYLTAGLDSRQAIARSNNLTREKTGVDCLKMLGVPHLSEPSSLFAYIEERCELGQGLTVPTYDLYADYLDWCRREEATTMGRNMFYKELTSQVPDVRRTLDENRHLQFSGICLLQVSLGRIKIS